MATALSFQSPARGNRSKFRVTKRTSLAAKQKLAAELTELTDHRVRVSFEPRVFETYGRNNDATRPGTQGHLWCCNVIDFDDMPFVNDSSGEDMRLLMADALEDYLEPLLEIVEGLRAAVAEESKSDSAERCAVVLEHNDRREVVFMGSQQLCDRWVEQWKDGETHGVNAVVLPIVETLDGRQFNGLKGGAA